MCTKERKDNSKTAKTTSGENYYVKRTRKRISDQCRPQQPSAFSNVITGLELVMKCQLKSTQWWCTEITSVILTSLGNSTTRLRRSILYFHEKNETSLSKAIR